MPIILGKKRQGVFSLQPICLENSKFDECPIGETKSLTSHHQHWTLFHRSTHPNFIWDFLQVHKILQHQDNQTLSFKQQKSSLNLKSRKITQTSWWSIDCDIARSVPITMEYWIVTLLYIDTGHEY